MTLLPSERKPCQQSRIDPQPALIVGFFIRDRKGGMLGFSPVHLLVFALIAILLLRRKLSRPRFSVRDLLILTTLVAVALGWIVYMARNNSQQHPAGPHSVRPAAT